MLLPHTFCLISLGGHWWAYITWNRHLALQHLFGIILEGVCIAGPCVEVLAKKSVEDIVKPENKEERARVLRFGFLLMSWKDLVVQNGLFSVTEAGQEVRMASARVQRMIASTAAVQRQVRLCEHLYRILNGFPAVGPVNVSAEITAILGLPTPPPPPPQTGLVLSICPQAADSLEAGPRITQPRRL